MASSIALALNSVLLSSVCFCGFSTVPNSSQLTRLSGIVDSALKDIASGTEVLGKASSDLSTIPLKNTLSFSSI